MPPMWYKGGDETVWTGGKEGGKWGERARESVRVGIRKGDLPEAQKRYPKRSAFLPHVHGDQGPTNCLEETSRAEFS